MNGSAKHAVKFTLVGKGNAVSLNLETKHLQIKPTCTGSVTTRTLQIHNPTGVPMHYHWKACAAVLGTGRVPTGLSGRTRGWDSARVLAVVVARSAFAMRCPVLIGYAAPGTGAALLCCYTENGDAVPGTIGGYAATGTERGDAGTRNERHTLHWHFAPKRCDSATCLRASYAMPGTDVRELSIWYAVLTQYRLRDCWY
eukprot:2979169-Rhodomonas_salina.1